MVTVYIPQKSLLYVQSPGDWCLFHPYSFRKERCTVALHSHRKWQLESQNSLVQCVPSPLFRHNLLLSASFSPRWQACPNFTVFYAFTSLLFSKVRIKPTPTLRVGGRTSRQWHITFLSFYRPNFHALQNHSFPGCQRALYYAFWFGVVVVSCWC